MNTLNEQSALKLVWQPLAVLAVFLLFVAVTPGLSGFYFDLQFFTRWAQHIHSNGLRNAYGSGTDYLPFYQYVLWFYGKLCGTNDLIAARINYLRLFTLLFEFWGLAIVYKWINRREVFPLFLILALSNIGFSYNTLIWSQVDSIWTAMGFASLYYAWRKSLAWSTFFMTLALCTKLQAVIFLPLLGLLLLYSFLWFSPKQIAKELVLILITALSTTAIILTPFALGDQGIGAIWRILSDSFGRFPVVTLSADNMWILLVPRAASVNDSLAAFAGISYRVVGLSAFFLGTFFTLLPLIVHSIKMKRLQPFHWQPLDKQLLWLSGALVCILFFYCNTEMHERYVHPAAIFLTAFAFHTRKWGAYLLFSLAYFLNLEVVYQWFNLPNYGTLIFNPYFVASLYTLVIIWLSVLLYQRYQCLTAEYSLRTQAA